MSNSQENNTLSPSAGASASAAHQPSAPGAAAPPPVRQPLTYRDAGVDIAQADTFVSRIAGLAKATHIPGVLPGRGEYAALFRPNLAGLADPVLAATCDGVGTKLLVARDMGLFSDLGQDLVGMNVNDLLPVGAQPLFFLDYIATGKLHAAQLEQVLQGVARACVAAQCALLGGETAEMPDLYARGDFDLAGFAVGLVDGARVPQPHTVQVGDKVLALASSGVHANGLSLARKALLERGGLKLDDFVSELGTTLGEELLKPTCIYVRDVLALMQRVTVKTAAHVTGGGLLGRAERLVQAGQRLVIDAACYRIPPIFGLIARCGDVVAAEMARTFNMGLGYLVVVSPADAQLAMAAFPGTWCEVGAVQAGAKGVDLGYAASP